MLLTLAPIVGGISYLASWSVRMEHIIRLILDQVADKMRFELYTRMRLGRRLAPARIPAAR